MEDIKLNNMNGSIKDSTVVIRNAYKRYTPQNVILNGLNMTVPTGNIYCLLGPSGCGKTSLLRAIIGQVTLDAGSIQLSITKRSQIGYMPQTLSLYLQMTIFENCYFYGYLFGMTSEEVKTAALDLIVRLDLPSGHTLVNELSGGEQRRVSVALAFIHNPEVLLLDEPTVGLDPMLIETIWKWFLKMAAGGKTIILTTHYLQEAHRSHMIGLMRNGVLLTEKAPNELLWEFGCESLEEVFLRLSHVQEIECKDKKIEFPDKNEAVRVHYEEDGKISREKLNAIVYKSVRLLRRDLRVPLFIVCLPALVVYIANLTIGGKPKNMHIAVINEETSTVECNPLSYYGCFLDEEQLVHLSCMYLELLRKRTYVIVEYSNEVVAQEDIRKRMALGLLHFSQNYTRALAQRVDEQFAVDAKVLENSILDAWIDMSNPIFGNFLYYDLVLSLRDFFKQAMINCELNPKIGAVPIKYEKPIYGTFDVEFKTYVLNVVMGLACFACSVLSGLVHLFAEKSTCVNERIMATGVSMTTIIMSIMSILTITLVVPLTVSMIVTYWYTGHALKGSMVILATLLILHGITGIMFGFMLALIFKNLMIAVFMAGSALIALALVSGIAWPIQLQHENLKSMHWAIVGVRMIEAIEAINVKGFTFSNPVVHAAFEHIFMHFLIFSLITYLLVRYKQ